MSAARFCTTSKLLSMYPTGFTSHVPCSGNILEPLRQPIQERPVLHGPGTCPHLGLGPN
jgi:hypothetical protein